MSLHQLHNISDVVNNVSARENMPVFGIVYVFVYTREPLLNKIFLLLLPSMSSAEGRHSLELWVSLG